MDGGARPLFGPTDQSERPETHRPVRIGAERLSHFITGEAAPFVIGGIGVLAAAVPALMPLLVPAILAHGTALAFRRPRLPLALPISANRIDVGDPAPGTREPREAAGIIYLGTDAFSGQEIWLTDAWARQHLSIPGVTGAGKTEALLALIANALTMGSGCVIVDGKADPKLRAQVDELARRYGRQSDVLFLNFLTASAKNPDSNTTNPFASGTADAIKEMLLSQVEQNPLGGAGGDKNAIFFQRASALLGAWTPALVWLRDSKRIPLDISVIRVATKLKSISSLVFNRTFRYPNPNTGKIEDIPVPDMPEGLVEPLRAYLGETPGYDPDQPWDNQKSTQPAEQHGYAEFHFSSTFNQMGVSLGHIFARGSSDIDWRDVILNRRILVVTLPTMENSGETTRALGKLVIASIRGMMAQAMGGAKIEGDSLDLVESRATESTTPFFVIMDEVASYAGAGLDTIMQQARSLGAMFALGFHDVESMLAGLGERAYTILNNTLTTVLMRQNAGGKTREHLERSIGEASVSRVRSIDTKFGPAQESRQLEIARESRIDWRDARGLIEGEAIIVRGNRRIYARMFNTGIKGRGVLRMNRPVPMPEARPEEARKMSERLEDIRTRLLAPEFPKETEPPPLFAALLDGFHAALHARFSRSAAAQAAICKLGSMPDEPEPPAPAPEPGTVPTTDFTPTLEATAAGPVTTGGHASLGVVGTSENTAAILAAITRIAEGLGANPEEARQEARRAVRAHEAALLAATLPAPPLPPPEGLLTLLEAAIREVRHSGRA